MAKRAEQLNTNPKPKREDFDRVLKALLDSGPVTREEIHQETRKRKKRAIKVIDGPINGNGNR